MRLLRAALEELDLIDGNPLESNDRVVMKGPLSDAYTEALNIVYAKSRPGQTGGGEVVTGMESQANDELMMQDLAESIVNATGGDAEEETPTTVYGVSADTVTEDDVVNVNKELYEQPEGQVVLVMDATGPGANSPNDSLPEERVMQLRTSLECMVTAHKGRVYPSLEAYAQARAKAKQHRK